MTPEPTPESTLESIPDPTAGPAPRPGAPGVPGRRPPTALEAKALAHPLRQRIVRQCGTREMTNKDSPTTSASRRARRCTTSASSCVPGCSSPRRSARAGGALERPYRATGATWWLDDPLRDAEPGARFGPVAAALDDALAAGPDAVTTSAAFYLHLSDDDVAELDRRILAVLDEYVASDADRHDRPLHRGLFVLHRPPS